MKIFLHRPFNVCSCWELFNEELLRTKQLFVNTNVPNRIIDQTIKNFSFRNFASGNIISLQDETKRTSKSPVNAETLYDESAKKFMKIR